jgi:hypothetical protein
MSSLDVVPGEISATSVPLALDQRQKMEAGIDLHAAAMVEEVAVEPPPMVDTATVEAPPLPEGGHPTASAAPIVPSPPSEHDDQATDAVPPVWSLDAESEDDELPAEPLLVELWAWMRANVHWYAISFAVHMLIFAALLFIFGRAVQESSESLVTLQPVNDDLTLGRHLDRFEIPSGAPEDPTELNAAVLLNPEIRPAPAEFNDNSPEFRKEGGGRNVDSGAEDVGGKGGFTVRGVGPGPTIAGAGGLGAEHGTSDRLGSGGSGEGFAGRGKGRRGEMLRLGGGTKDTEVAVAAALNWFYRHRNPSGSWSLSRFASHCSGNPCTGPGAADSDSAATALAVLPFLGAGETHKSKGPYQETVKQALFFLTRRQTGNGDLSGGTGHQMYAHALATLALCEAYGMTKDPKIGDAAQRAVLFIEAAQNKSSGGWRYVPGDPTGGDTSVLGWQIMALRSAQLAGLAVDTLTMENAKKWLASCSKGYQHGQYSYQPFKDATPAITAIGMLSWQYLGMRADDPAMVESKQYLLQHLPENGTRNTYYWYYGTQAMHNLLGSGWDTWNRQMRRALVRTQCREGCAAGSWDPEIPSLDAWSEQGGRIMTTAFSTLSLEVYYRYLPLYNLHGSASDLAPAMIPADDAK